VDAVLSVLNALGMPHHRLTQWQKWAGIPLPASTQFERVEAMANAVFPGFRHILPLEERDDKSDRKPPGAGLRVGSF
jgi:hypothetical protein